MVAVGKLWLGDAEGSVPPTCSQGRMGTTRGNWDVETWSCLCTPTPGRGIQNPKFVSFEDYAAAIFRESSPAPQCVEPRDLWVLPREGLRAITGAFGN